MFRNKKSEILWGLKPPATCMAQRIVKRQDGSVQFTILWCHQERKSSLGWPVKTIKLVVPSLPLPRHSYDLTANLEAVLARLSLFSQLWTVMTMNQTARERVPT